MITGRTDRRTDGQTDRQTDRQSATQYAAPSYGGGPHNKCSKVFAFGFVVCVKTISQLVNCLINDALLDSRPCCNQTLLKLINVPRWLLIKTFPHYSLYLIVHRIGVMTVGSSDVKFHEFFCLEIFHEIFHEIFLKYFKNFTIFFSGFTLTCLTFFIRQTLLFIHLCILQLPKPICRPTCLVCLFKYGLKTNMIGHTRGTH